MPDANSFRSLTRLTNNASHAAFDALSWAASTVTAVRIFSHRRAWILDRMATLSAMFAIDVCAYAIMSNHYHLVLKADADRAQAWSTDDVIDRWTILFAGPDLIKRYRTGTGLGPAEQRTVMEIVDAWRERLCDISWYMRILNEHIARLANAEDACTGRFWEGRFRSQALLDEQAVLTCMAYVDLNPIRAKTAHTPEQSDFTSIQQRISAVQDETRQSSPTTSVSPRYPFATATDTIADPALPTDNAIASPSCPLLDFIGWKTTSAGIPLRLDDYLELVDWSGRIVRADKSGVMNACLPPILARLGIDAAAFLKHVLPMQSPTTSLRQTQPFFTATGTPASLNGTAVRWCQKFFKGVRKAQRLFPDCRFS